MVFGQELVYPARMSSDIRIAPSILSADLGHLAREIAEVEAANERLQAELEYVRSAAFIGAEARRLSNVGSPGEEALIIPPGAEAPLPQPSGNVPDQGNVIIGGPLVEVVVFQSIATGSAYFMSRSCRFE